MAKKSQAMEGHQRRKEFPGAQQSRQHLRGAGVDEFEGRELLEAMPDLRHEGVGDFDSDGGGVCVGEGLELPPQLRRHTPECTETHVDDRNMSQSGAGVVHQGLRQVVDHSAASAVEFYLLEGAQRLRRFEYKLGFECSAAEVAEGEAPEAAPVAADGLEETGAHVVGAGERDVLHVSPESGKEEQPHLAESPTIETEPPQVGAFLRYGIDVQVVPHLASICTGGKASTW
eukprot:GHVU01066770.1.p2 GENE.GHVU01066770.1~~GHVU01066770.1.p2  ORF type:complete len:230 (+),score=30.19 GHVU01066770.1:390-1079(+)